RCGGPGKSSPGAAVRGRGRAVPARGRPAGAQRGRARRALRRRHHRVLRRAVFRLGAAHAEPAGVMPLERSTDALGPERSHSASSAGHPRLEPGTDALAPTVEFEDVAFAYARAAGRRARAFAFPGLSFSIERGEVFGVIGPNSAGKTSLLRLLTRVLSRQRGAIRLAGRAISTLRPWELAREVAVVPQEAP